MLEFIGRGIKAAASYLPWPKSEQSPSDKLIAINRGLRSDLRAAQYDHQRENDSTKQHFLNATLNSADGHANESARKTARKDVRYEYANSTILKGVVLTRTNTLIGKGPKLRLVPDPSRINKPETDDNLTALVKSIEKKINKFLCKQNICQKLGQMVKAKLVDGESFMVFLPHELSDFDFHIRVFDCDRVTSDYGDTQGEEDYVDGIRYDDVTGEPTHFRFLKKHPYGEYTQGNLQQQLGNQKEDYHFAGHQSVFHWFRQDFGEQHRGISELLASLDISAILRRVRTAIATSIETAANLSLVLESDLDPEEDEEITLPENWESIPTTPNTMTVLPNKMTASQMKAEHPNAAYEAFRDACYSDIGRQLDMPFNRVSGSSASYNFSSAMIDGLHDLLSCEIERGHLRVHCLDKILTMIIAVAVTDPSNAVFTSDELRYLSGRSDGDILPERSWFFETEGDEIDPLKQTNAKVAAIAGGIATRSSVIAKRGGDIDTEDAIAAKDFGVTVEEYRRGLFMKMIMEQPEPEEESNDDKKKESGKAEK